LVAYLVYYVPKSKKDNTGKEIPQTTTADEDNEVNISLVNPNNP